ncbi:MAG: TonB-dependent receptor plug domain-containing protein [Chitinophagaceae bacterium]|nr:TonB-dependent receptor plug domain-containing protein [Chitinophagaceae bacterium]
MKKIFGMAILCLSTFVVLAQGKPFNDTMFLQPVEVQAVRASDKAPFAKSNLGKKEIAKNNLGQDLPFLLNQLPSVVVNADAGNGVGYTGIRIRGTDATRINVTLNGIPYNDAESQGTFFVDLPDMASSVNSIQVQRGVGTSSNGAGAFGATINLSTNEINRKHYASINNSYGSFDTWKNNFLFGSGIFARHFILEGRLSSIRSKGYIDRASSNLWSAFGSAAYVDDKHSVRLNIFTGKEKTYQAWNGVPEYLLKSDRTYNSSGTEKAGDPYNNETDNYQQTHYQLFYNQKFNASWKGNLALFFTKGRGYYEQFKAGQKLADYGLPDYVDGNQTITETDLVRRLWLDNDFYGSIFSLHYQHPKTQLVFGGGYNGYDAIHYGEVTWAAVAPAVPAHYHWYDLTAYKNDLSVYGKWTQQITPAIQAFADLQFRNVRYRINGFRNNPTLRLNNHYAFFNPKLGVTVTHNGWQAYLSWAMANKEPNRDDFEAGTGQQPGAETLHDLEWGLERNGKTFSAGINFYYMRYRDQLILTGKINDVGAYTRTNIPNSYRAGIELQGQLNITSWFNFSGNMTFSENKIRNFTEYLDDYDNGGQQSVFYQKTTISFSPSLIGGASLNFIPVKNALISLIGKYVGCQFLDNTGNKARSLDPFYVQDLRLSYGISGKRIKKAELIGQLNNIFNRKYEPNGYSFSYIYGGSTTTENFYYPMAGFNVMVGLNVGF